MKTLHLIRHAKSSWKFPSLSDHQRPLNKRGRKDTAIMASALFDSGFEWPDIYCSSAVRAQQTIQGISDHWQGQAFNWRIVDALYEFSMSNLLMWLEQKFKNNEEILIVSHNPSLTNLINHLSHSDIVNFPTCAYAQIDFSELNKSDGQLKQLLKPKMYK